MDLIESEKSHCYNFQCQQGKRQLGKKGRIQMLKLEQIKKSYDGVEILKEMNLDCFDIGTIRMRKDNTAESDFRDYGSRQRKDLV